MSFLKNHNSYREGIMKIVTILFLAICLSFQSAFALEKGPSEPQPAKEVYPEGTRGGPMVLIPAGEFMMGCASGDNHCGNDEKPFHKVSLDAYHIDKYPVTVAQYHECMADKKCSEPGTGGSCNWNVSGREKHPINCVNWNEAAAYCTWAGKRLPTGAEWEKAARGTDGRIYPWGNEWDCHKSCNSVSPCSNSSTCAVGSYKDGKSPYGVMDMAGNVWEWMNDWYDEDYYASHSPENPKGPSSGLLRVLRGGSWRSYKTKLLRASNRDGLVPKLRDVRNGFRCVHQSQ